MSAEPRETILPVDGASLAVRELGEGRPLVVLHGGPDFDDAYLLPEVDRLADLGRLVLYAQRGRGRSYRGETAEDVGIASEVADLDAIRAWTGHDRIALIGHSWGCLLAMEYATRQPDRVSHLVLVSPAPASHPDAIRLRRHLRSLRTPAQLRRMTELRADPAFLAGDVEAEAEYYRIHFAKALSAPDDVEVVVRRLRRTFTPEAIVAARAIEDRLYEQTWDIASYDLLPALGSVDAPNVVVMGDHDFIPPEGAERIAGALPGGKLTVLDDCGHFAFMEQPEALHEAIAETLEA